MSYSTFFDKTGTDILGVSENSSNINLGYSELFIIPANLISFYNGTADITLNQAGTLDEYLKGASGILQANGDFQNDGAGDYYTYEAQVNSTTTDDFIFKSLGHMTEDGVTRGTNREDVTEFKNAKGDVVKTSSGSKTETMSFTLMESGTILEDFISTLGDESYLVVSRQVVDNVRKDDTTGWYPSGTKLIYRFYFNCTISKSGDSADAYNQTSNTPIEVTASLPSIPSQAANSGRLIKQIEIIVP